jgi:glycosyltransferase involved in cell wall biosynthesis
MGKGVGTRVKMVKKSKITAIIIAKNEEEKLGECLTSLKWTDQVLLVDSGSIDKTMDIAKRNGAKVIKHEGGSYSDWRNAGLKKASGDWILYVDADERVTDSLRREVLRLISRGETRFNAYAIPRRNIVLGKELKHGGFGKYDYVKRLFKKDKLKRWVGELHEEPRFYHKGKLTSGGSGRVGHLESKILHLKAATLTEMIEKTNKWSQVEANLMFEAGHPPMNILRFLLTIFREFWLRFVRKRAYLDGTIGTIHGIYQIYSRFISYAKLWELQINDKGGVN